MGQCAGRGHDIVFPYTEFLTRRLETGDPRTVVAPVALGASFGPTLLPTALSVCQRTPLLGFLLSLTALMTL
jgi:hypothetical protein